MNRLPNVKAKEAVAALKKAGFRESHQRGSHLYLFNDETRRMTSVPMHPGELKRGLLKAIIKQSGLTENEFRKLL